MRIYFSKLIGSHYSSEQKMLVLDWMLKTGLPFSKYVGKWNRVGISQLLYNYSANDHHYKQSIPFMPSKWDWWFDAIFSRAVYRTDVYFPIIEWRKSENIYSEKYRVLEFNQSIPKEYRKDHMTLPWLIHAIYSLKGKYLNKNFHHKGWTERTKPKIISIKVFTCGAGWRVEYGFSFLEFDYEPGWHFGYYQKEGQSLWEFFGDTLKDINNRCLINQ